VAVRWSAWGGILEYERKGPRPTGVPQAVLLTRVPAEGRGAARDARWDLAAAGYDVLGTEIPQNRQKYADVWGTVPEDLGAYEALADELLEREK
jgi:hypothetical protein